MRGSSYGLLRRIREGERAHGATLVAPSERVVVGEHPHGRTATREPLVRNPGGVLVPVSRTTPRWREREMERLARGEAAGKEVSL